MLISYRDTSGDNDEEDDDVFDQVASFKGVAQSYQLNFAPGIRNLHARLETAVREGASRLTTLQRTGRSFKYYLSLRCNFYKPADPDTVTNEPCAFNSGTSTLLPSSSIKTQMEINYISILQAVENYERNGSGKLIIYFENDHISDIYSLQINPNSSYLYFRFFCNSFNFVVGKVEKYKKKVKMQWIFA